jgi:integrase
VLNGLRVSEAVAIAGADLDEARGHRLVRIRRKGGALVDVPLAPRTAAALDELRAVVGSGAPRLFLDGRGAPLDRFDAARVVRRLARRADIAHAISPHSLRHTFVTAALDAGVPLRDVQDAAGHADPRTTRRYDRGRYSLDRHATYAVARYLG